MNSARRLISLLLVAALVLATVWTSGIATAGMMGSHQDSIATNGDMMCSSCDLMKNAISGCSQMSCLGATVIAESGTFLGVLRQVFFETSLLMPDEISSAPPTPPI